jgi:NhaP-type Na+/H+ or K+/H+ antiporter
MKETYAQRYWYFLKACSVRIPAAPFQHIVASSVFSSVKEIGEHLLFIFKELLVALIFLLVLCTYPVSVFILPFFIIEVEKRNKAAHQKHLDEMNRGIGI